MLNINKDSVFYIFCGLYGHSGGEEALHQFSDALSHFNIKNFMCYFLPVENKINLFFPTEIPQDKFRKYKRCSIAKIAPDDSPNNIFIIPEVYPFFLDFFPKSQKCIWYLSVNYAIDNLKKFKNDKIISLYQSHYARYYLNFNNFRYIYPLFDYIHSSEIPNCNDKFPKQNIITYSIKSKNFVDKIKDDIIKAGFQLVFLHDMTKNTLIDYLKISKIHIDFGMHPGKDRIPREAALYDNIIIVGSSGSASYFEDLPFPDKYKIGISEISDIVFDKKNHLNDKHIIDTIIDCANNYDSYLSDFSFYKYVIKKQESEFFNQVQFLTQS